MARESPAGANGKKLWSGAPVASVDTKEQWQPARECVIDSLAKGAARQITAGLFEEHQSAVVALADRTTLAHCVQQPFVWTCLGPAQVLLDTVEMSDLTQDPSATLRGLLARLVEVASHVGPASRQR